MRDVKDKLLKQVEMCVQNSVNADNVNILKEHTSLQSNLFQCIKKSALFCLDLASSSGSSHLNLLCLVNMTGVNILFGSTACASKYWEEAFNLLVSVYLVDWITVDVGNNPLPSVPSMCPKLPQSLRNDVGIIVNRLCVALLYMDSAFQLKYSAIMFLNLMIIY